MDNECRQLDQLLGFLSGSGQKYTLKKVAETLTDILKQEINDKDVLQLGESGRLKVVRKEVFQPHDYDKSFNIRGAMHMPSPDNRFKDYLAWVKYEDLCEFVLLNLPQNQIPIDEKEIYDLLSKSEAFCRLKNIVLNAPIEDFRQRGKSLTDLKEDLNEKGHFKNEREAHVFISIIAEIYNFGRGYEK